ncbi:MAG: enoyl-CoA hydratase/isomerase family protein [Proteobacteria bacterium]|nr:enoyl-CoA hydratase/isomerase family protein [Pseudomonadota bacterium]
MSASPTTLQVERESGVARIALARPEVHNAFDDVLIAELTATLEQLDADADVRAVVLTGSGHSFSAGADLSWMRRMAQASAEENRADALRLARLMRLLDGLSKPTIARVNGAAFGGGVGLVACCDIAIASETAMLGLSEVKLGLVPAVISPYVIAAIGVRQARRWFQTAESFKAGEAQRMGLVHEVASPQSLDTHVQHQCDLLLKNGPVAVKEAKLLARRMAMPADATTVDAANADLIARLRVSPEGQEGLSAFLDKRKPGWIPREGALSIPDT